MLVTLWKESRTTFDTYTPKKTSILPKRDFEYIVRINQNNIPVRKLTESDLTTNGHSKDNSARTLKAANRAISSSHPNTRSHVIQQARKGNH